MDEEVFDFSLADIEYELWALEEHLKALEAQINSLQRSDQFHAHTALHSDTSDPDVARAERDAQEHRVKYLLPRLFRGSFLILVWAVFEAAFLEVADLLRERTSSVVKVPKAKPAATLVDRLSRYITADLELPFVLSPSCKEQLADLLVVRDSFAHANGRTDAIRPDRMASLKRIIESGKVAEEDGFLIPSASFIRHCYDAVSEALRALTRTYEQAA